MRPVSKLESLAETLCWRLNKLQVIANQIREKSNRYCTVKITYVVVESLSLWQLFCRTYYLSCILNNAHTANGRKVIHKCRNNLKENDAILEAVRIVKPAIFDKLDSSNLVAPQNEPQWHNKGVLTKLASELSFSHIECIVDALSHPTRVMDDLPPIRNFYAHRSKKSATVVKSIAASIYGVHLLAHATDLVNKTLSGRQNPLLVDWLVDLRVIGCDLCEYKYPKSYRPVV